MPSDDQLAFIEENHFYMSHAEMAEQLGIAESTLSRWKADHLDLPRASDRNRVEHEYGAEICEVLHKLHNEERMTTTEMSSELGVSRATLERWWEDCPTVHKRTQSEAIKEHYKSTTEEERKEIVAAAQEARRKKRAQFRTTVRGYEQWRCGRYDSEHVVKHHRLLATLLVDDIGDLDGMHVHHKNGVSWDNRPRNLEVLDPVEHAKLHDEGRRDEVSGRFA